MLGEEVESLIGILKESPQAHRQLSSPADDALSHAFRQEQSRAAAYHLKWPIVAPNDPSVYFEEVSMPCFVIVAEWHQACRARLVESREAFCTEDPCFS